MDIDEEENVRKITEFINKQKSQLQKSFQIEFEDFVSVNPLSDDENDDSPKINDPDSLTENGEQITLDSILRPKTQIENVQTKRDHIILQHPIIASCQCKILKEALILNRLKNQQIAIVAQKVNSLLQKVDQKVAEHKSPNSASSQWLSNLKKPPLVWKLAAPYFKTRQYYQSPPNSDVAKKQKANELSPYYFLQVPKCWSSIIEYDRLNNAVRASYKLNRQKEIRRKIHSLTKNKENKDEIDTLLQLMERIDDDGKVPPVNSNELIDWHKIANLYFNDKRCAEEIRSMWHLIVHPALNHSEWTDEEHKRLKELACKYKAQNWDAIASELNTNRSSYTVCVEYYRKLGENTRRYFTSDEDALLRHLIAEFGIENRIPWDKIVPQFDGRSRRQLHHRFVYHLQERNIKKGKFTESEDILILILAHKFDLNFSKFIEFMPHRKVGAIKSRYHSNLKHDVKKGTFSAEEDAQIMAHVETHGAKNWPILSAVLKRSAGQLRQRHGIILNYLKDNPGGAVCDIPRLRYRFDKNAADNFSFLHFMADKYKELDFVPSLAMIEDSLQVQSKTTKRDKSTKKSLSIDNMLTDFFASSAKLKNTKWMGKSAFDEAAGNLGSILGALGAQLDIPSQVALETHAQLDAYDVELLSRLSAEKAATSCKVQLLAPNLNTLIALRGLIIKHRSNKSGLGVWDVEDNLWEMDEGVETNRNLFEQRFDSLFKWSAILSLVKPRLQDAVDSGSEEIVEVEPPKKMCKLDEYYENDYQDMVLSEEVLVEEEDLMDVEKLNSFLANVKSENQNSIKL